jgi:O-antigen/teichoic acid export membrane protein
VVKTEDRNPARPRVTLDNDGTREEEVDAKSYAQVASPTARQPGLSLTQNFVWTLGGNVIGAGCQWAVVVLLAKIASTEVVGDFALAVAVAVPIAFLGDFRLRVLFVTDAADKYPFREMLGLRLILSCLSLMVILATCDVVGYGRSTTLITLIVGSAYIVDSISDTYYGRFQRAERMDRIAKSLIIRNILSVTAFTLAVYFTRRLLWGVCGLALGRGLILMLYDARIGAEELCTSAVLNGPRVRQQTYFNGFRPAWNVGRQLQMLWVASPLAICAMLVSVNGYVPRYLLESFVGRREVGLYAAINYIPSGCFLAVTALGYAVFARLSKLFAKGDMVGFKLLLVKIAVIYGSLGVGGLLLSVIAGRQVLTLVYRPEYAQHVDLLRWLMIVGFVNCLTTAMQCGLTATAQFRVQVPLFAGVTAISLVGSAILIPRLGLVGASVAALISSIVQLCASASLVFRTMGKRARELKNMECAQLEAAVEVQ